jgi:hypothetical protein
MGTMNIVILSLRVDCQKCGYGFQTDMTTLGMAGITTASNLSDFGNITFPEWTKYADQVLFARTGIRVGEFISDTLNRMCFEVLDREYHNLSSPYHAVEKFMQAWEDWQRDIDND